MDSENMLDVLEALSIHNEASELAKVVRRRVQEISDEQGNDADVAHDLAMRLLDALAKENTENSVVFGAVGLLMTLVAHSVQSKENASEEMVIIAALTDIAMGALRELERRTRKAGMH